MRPSRLVSPLLLLLVAAACSSSGSARPAAGTAPTPTTVRMDSPEGGMDLQITRSDPTAQHRLQMTADEAWRALPAVFDELKIPVTALVASERRMGNPSFRVRRQLGGERLSRYLDCGERLGERNADTYELTMRVETMVRPAEGGSTLVTAINATGRPMGTSGNTVNCTTTGRLEERILSMLGKSSGR